MSKHDVPFVQPTRSPRSSRLAASVVAGIALVAGPAFADPVEEAPAEEAQAELAADEIVDEATAAEDATVVMEGETAEAAVTRIEAEVAQAETDLTTAQECATPGTNGRGPAARTDCPSAEAAQAALALRRERLMRSRRHERTTKRMRTMRHAPARRVRR